MGENALGKPAVAGTNLGFFTIKRARTTPRETARIVPHRSTSGGCLLRGDRPSPVDLNERAGPERSSRVRVGTCGKGAVL